MTSEQLVEFNKELEALQLKYNVIIGVEHKIVVNPKEEPAPITAKK